MHEEGAEVLQKAIGGRPVVDWLQFLQGLSKWNLMAPPSGDETISSPKGW